MGLAPIDCIWVGRPRRWSSFPNYKKQCLFSVNVLDLISREFEWSINIPIFKKQRHYPGLAVGRFDDAIVVGWGAQCASQDAWRWNMEFVRVLYWIFLQYVITRQPYQICEQASSELTKIGTFQYTCGLYFLNLLEVITVPGGPSLPIFGRIGRPPGLHPELQVRLLKRPPSVCVYTVKNVHC